LRRRQGQSPEPERWWDRRLLLLITILVLLLILIPALVFRDQGGRPLGWPGAFVWLAVGISSFLLTLLFLSAFLLPAGAQPEGEGHFPEDVSKTWREGLLLLYRYLRTALVPWGQGDRKEIPGLGVESADVLQRFGAAMIDRHLALALFKGTTYSRTVGPGYVRLRKGERVGEVIDLRMQRRQQEVTVVTRDGIPLETTVSVTFRIRQPDTTGPFPYEQDTIFYLTNAGGVRPDSETITWDDRICPLAADILINEISPFQLDTIFELDDLTFSPLEEVRANVENKLRAEIPKLFNCPPNRNPIQITAVTIGDLLPPDEIIKQRIELWKEECQPYMSRQQFEGRAEAAEYLQAARARTQVEMLDRLAKDMAVLNPPLDDEDWNDMVILRTIAALENMVIDNNAHPETVRKMIGLFAELSQWFE